MINISYVHDFEVVCSYQRNGNEGRDIVLPRQDELVDMDNTLYRVEKVTHVFRLNANDDTEQQIIITLTKQLVKRSI